MTKTTRTQTKTKAKATPATKPEGSRYYRAARVIIAAGDGDDIDLMRIVADARLSLSSAKYCLEACHGVVQALREAGRLADVPTKPKRAPKAPTKRRSVAERAAEVVIADAEAKPVAEAVA